MLTSVYPFVHGANEREEVLTPLALTMPEWLRRYGYLCSALVANSNIGAYYGFAQGFDSYRLLLDYSGDIYKSVNEVWPVLESWLRAHADERFFLYLQTVDPHIPYHPKDPYRSRFCRPDGLEEFTVEMMAAINEGRRVLSEQELDQLRDLYDAQINLTDDYFGRLDALLTELGLSDHTIVVVTSDHGEQFLEHGFITHGIDLFREEIQVPLMLRFPRRIPPGLRIEARVQTLDLMPTLLELAGIRPPPNLDGHSILPLLDQVDPDPAPTTEKDVYCELRLDGRQVDALLRGQNKFMLHHDQGRVQLFDLLADPAEQEPITSGSRLEELRRAVEHLRRSRRPLEQRPQRRELDEEQLRMLKALGYAR
jgi:arylsulfatase A-like enzyme